MTANPTRPPAEPATTGIGPFRYQLTGFPTQANCVAGEPLIIRGALINTGSAALDFRPDAPLRVEIGARLHPAGADPTGKPDEISLLQVLGGAANAALAPEQGGSFELTLPTQELTPGNYVAVIDLVVDGSVWLGDAGHTPHRLDVVCEPAPLPRYLLRFDPPKEHDRTPTVVRLSGVLTNTGDQPLSFDGRGDQTKIGARIYRGRIDDAGSAGELPVLEARGTVFQETVKPGNQAPFELFIPIRSLGGAPHVAVVDLLVENRFWFADRGHDPYRIDLIDHPAGTAEIAGGAEWRRLAAIAAAHKLSLPPPGRLAGAGQQADETAEILNEIAELPDISVPISRFMLHLRAAYWLEDRWPLDSNLNALDFAKWYLLDAPTELGLEQRPVAPPLLDYLNAGAFEPWLLPWRVSRFALSMAVNSTAPFDLRDGRSIEDLAFWWIGDFTLRRLVDDAAIPAELLPVLLGYHLHATADEIGASSFLSRFVAVNPIHANRYDITTADDRIALSFELLVRLLGRSTLGAALAKGWAPFFATRADADEFAPTRFELLYWCHAGRPVIDGEPATSAAIRHWFRSGPCRSNPALRVYASIESDTLSPEPEAPRCLVIGSPGAPSGLGENARMSIDALARIGLSPVVVDLEIPDRKSVPVPAALLHRSVALFHVNAETVPQALLHPEVDRSSYRIGYFVWELDAIPEAHRLALDLVDEIWVPSEFVRAAYARFTDRPIVVTGKGIGLDPSVSGPSDPRSGDFTFMVAFDFNSGVERKNPLAAVRAFQQAFPAPNTAVSLVVKTTPAPHQHWGDPHRQWRDIIDAANRDPRIKLLVDELPHHDFLTLIASADCVVSAHRAEGFGYIPAYALLLARPLIVTDYSGTQDFCDEDVAFPVRWTAKPIERGEFYFDVDGAVWADIDIDHLAERMREVHADPEAARTRALRGCERLSSLYSPERCAQGYRARLARLGLISD